MANEATSEEFYRNYFFAPDRPVDGTTVFVLPGTTESASFEVTFHHPDRPVSGTTFMKSTAETSDSASTASPEQAHAVGTTVAPKVFEQP